jgi:uncharacterized metal-binding protein
MCATEQYDVGSPNVRCPTRVKRDVITQAVAEYQKPDIYEFARQASVQEYECYMRLPEGITPRNPRVEEIVQFSKKMGYKKLGVAFCTGLKREAETLNTILENRGFTVSSVCCKLGGTPKEQIGIREEEKIIGPGLWETMCSPIAQAMVLNDEGVDLNILMGLCVGHDSLFFRYAEALTTVLVVKDRVLGHNPAAGLYLSCSYYGKLLRTE